MADRAAPQRAQATRAEASTHVAARPPRRRSAARLAGWPHADFSAVPLQPLVASLPSTGGSPLPDDVVSDLERTTGVADALASVRVHGGGASARAATLLGAEAFTVGTDVHLGATASADDHRLLLHEGAHALQQRGRRASVTRVSQPGDVFEVNADAVVGAATNGRATPVLTGAAGRVQRKTSDTVRDKLSYGVFDWAITDAEARDSLALLADLPDQALDDALDELGAKYVGRLIDNLPEELKTGAQYQRIVEHAGLARTMGYVDDRLSRGFFDWAVTDEDVDEIYNVYANYSQSQQDAFWERLEGSGKVGTLIDNGDESHEILYVRPWLRRIPRGEASERWQQRAMKAILDETDSVATADLLLETRFDLVVGSISATHATTDRRARQFSVAQMRTLWRQLALLPPEHVAENPDLDRLTSYAGDDNAWYFASTDEASLGGGGDNDAFEANLRHEVGHSVDSKLGWRNSGEPAKPERGGWKTYADSAAAATDAVELSDAGVKALGGAERALVEAEMVKVMDDHAKNLADLKKAIREVDTFKNMAAADRGRVLPGVLADPALRAVTANRNIDDKEPWWRDDGGVRLGNPARIVQESYDGRWVSYLWSARSRRVSDYQFRAPGEWFAEVYEKYYGGTDGRKKLHQKDPDTEKYFDDHVHGK